MNLRNLIGDKDVVYVYKEQWFTGFAPCFNDKMYSLACCKGRKNGGGMRDSACKKKAENKNVWILSIAGKDLSLKNHNWSGIKYDYEDMICLAKVTDCYSWPEYAKLYPNRRDSIYYLNDNGDLSWKNNEYGDHPDGSFMETDCELKTDDYLTRKQVLVSNEYYIFQPGNKSVYDIKRGFGVNYIYPIKLRDYLNSHEDCMQFRPNLIFRRY